jgi:hypothetical protein
LDVVCISLFGGSGFSTPEYLSQYTDGLDDQKTGVRFKEEERNFLFSTASTPAVGPVSLITSGYRGLSAEVKGLENELDYSPPPRAEVKFAWSCASTP